MTIITVLIVPVFYLYLFCPWMSFSLVTAPLSVFLIGNCFMSNSIFCALKEVEKQKSLIAAHVKQLGDRKAAEQQPFTALERDTCNAFIDLLSVVSSCGSVFSLVFPVLDDPLFSVDSDCGMFLVVSDCEFLAFVSVSCMFELELLHGYDGEGYTLSDRVVFSQKDCEEQVFCKETPASQVKRCSRSPSPSPSPSILKASRCNIPVVVLEDKGEKILQWLNELEAVYPDVLREIDLLGRNCTMKVKALVKHSDAPPFLHAYHWLLYGYSQFDMYITNDDLEGLQTMIVEFSRQLAKEKGCREVSAEDALIQVDWKPTVVKDCASSFDDLETVAQIEVEVESNQKWEFDLAIVLARDRPAEEKLPPGILVEDTAHLNTILLDFGGSDSVAGLSCASSPIQESTPSCASSTFGMDSPPSLDELSGGYWRESDSESACEMDPTPSLPANIGALSEPRRSRRIRGLPPSYSTDGSEHVPPRRSQRLACLPRINYSGM